MLNLSYSASARLDSQRKDLSIGVVIPSGGLKLWHRNIVGDIKKILSNAHIHIITANSDEKVTHWQNRRKTQSGWDTLVDYRNDKDFAKWNCSFIDFTDALIAGRQWDYLINLTGESATILMIDSAKSGVIEYKIGESSEIGLPLLISEFSNSRTNTTLSINLVNNQGAFVLSSAIVPVYPRSYKRTVDEILDVISKMPAVEIKKLNENVAINLTPAVNEPLGNHISMASHLYADLASRVENVKGMISSLFSHEHWNIGVAKQNVRDILDENKPLNITWMPKPKRGEYRADPFGIIDENGLTIMCEEYDYQSELGRLVTIKPDESKSAPIPVMVSDFHASYPYVFKAGDETYCLPEFSKTKELWLYHLNTEENNWEKYARLLSNVAAVDPNIIKHNDIWWLIFTDGETHCELSLNIYYSRDLKGPWIAHEMNPVKQDIRSTRPGGTPFQIDGVWYRPAQDCSETYGGRIKINKITKLTTTEFEEETVRVLEPIAPYLDGLHTFSVCGDYLLIDGKTYRFSFSAMAKLLSRKLAPITRRVDRLSSIITNQASKLIPKVRKTFTSLFSHIW